MSLRDMNHITVRPVIELGIETVMPSNNTLGGQLAVEIQKQAPAAHYIKTLMDGSFPLRC